MFPLYISALFIALVTFYVAQDIPKKEAHRFEVAADVSATNFIAYRRAVQRYVAANPAATGTISDSDLAGFWLPGYIRDTNWTNSVSGGALYVWSTGQVAGNTLYSIHRKSGENALLGTKSPANGNLRATNGFDTGISLPSTIPDEAIVMMGR